MFAIIRDAGWPIWPLIACSIVALALIVERFIVLRRDKVIPPKLVDEAINVSASGPPRAETLNQLAQNSALGEILAGGLRALASNPRITATQLSGVIEGAGRAAVQKLDKNLAMLGTIASVATLLGLLGTVIGMIEIFGAQGSASGTSPEQLARGISIALYNTAFGLIVAVPALVFWRYFRSRVDDYALELELAGGRFLRHLEQFCSPR